MVTVTSSAASSSGTEASAKGLAVGTASSGTSSPPSSSSYEHPSSVQRLEAWLQLTWVSACQGKHGSAGHCAYDAEGNFSPERYLAFHKKCVSDRVIAGCGRSALMEELYCFWSVFLCENFVESLYNTFILYAEEDASAGYTTGLQYLFDYFECSLKLHFESARMCDFERLAAKYYDYLGLSYGLENLNAFYDSVDAAIKKAVGGSGSIPGQVHTCVTSADPFVAEMLAAWRAQQRFEAYTGGACHSPQRMCTLHALRCGYSKLPRRQASCAPGANSSSSSSCRAPCYNRSSSSDGSCETSVLPAVGRAKRQSRHKRSRVVSQQPSPPKAASGASQPKPPAHSSNSAANSSIKLTLKVTAQPYVPDWEAQPVADGSPDLSCLPDRLGEIFGD